MVSSFAVKGDGIQKEQHKVALGLANSTFALEKPI
jgi:hypothetical protein